MAKYRALTGIEWANRRIEAGDVVDDLPAKSIKWLRESNLIEPADGKEVVEAPVEEEPVVEEPAPVEEPAAPAADEEDDK